MKVDLLSSSSKLFHILAIRNDSIRPFSCQTCSRTLPLALIMVISPNLLGSPDGCDVVKIVATPRLSEGIMLCQRPQGYPYYETQ